MASWQIALKKNSLNRSTALIVVIALHIAAINYILHAKQPHPAQHIATSFQMRIVDDVEANSEKLLPLPLNLETPAVVIASPAVDIAPEHSIVNTPPILQLATSMAQTISTPTIATTGPRPDPDVENTFPIEAYPPAANIYGCI